MHKERSCLKELLVVKMYCTIIDWKISNSRQAKEIICQHDVIMSVNADGKCVEIYQHKNTDNVVTEIYVLACDKEEAVLMYVNGKNLELSNMGSILNQF